MESGELEKAEALDGKIEAENNVQDFGTSFGEKGLRLANTCIMKQIEKLMRVISDPSCDGGERFGTKKKSRTASAF